METTLPNGLVISTENVLRIVERASSDDYHNGIMWYVDAHNLARSISNGDLQRGAGVLAALSPRTDWGMNVNLAVRCFTYGSIHRGTLGANMRAANRIMSGESPSDVLIGTKVGSFYATILKPHDSGHVVIDTHAMSVAAGRELSDKEKRVIGRVGVYSAFADIYRAVSEEIDMLPSQVQSITWLAWRSMSKAERSE